MNRITFVALAALMVASCGGGSSADNDEAHQKAVSARNVDTPDASKAPGADENLQGAPAQAFNLRSNQIRTRHLMDGSVTAGKLGIKAVTINVSASATTGSSAADPTLAGGFLLGCSSAGNIDQVIDNVVLNGDGSVTVTLGVAATAQNNLRCTVMKPNGQGIS